MTTWTKEKLATYCRERRERAHKAGKCVVCTIRAPRAKLKTCQHCADKEKLRYAW